MTAEFLRTAVGLVAVVNPVGAIPSFLVLTERLGSDARRTAARRAATTAAVVLLVAAIAGTSLLRALGIGVPAFRVAGGLLLLVLAMSRLDPHAPAAAANSAADDGAIVPLGIPTLAGPGAISAVILHSQEAAGVHEAAALGLAVVAAGASAWTALRLAQPIGRMIGPTGIKVAGRLMALLLAAVAVGFIADGAATLFPALRR